ncbi:MULTISPECIES: Dyp-type peroxidase [unclassified Arsukibacterium]|uniref:Dyp-type peroxidase n=1 Tax=unclassified Arsukibacterium TaxID=2635278 RepID=UPI000C5C7B5D|nr:MULTISPECIES: Dyp-type peroxidase [unclassified Arsukibacterium]MAA95601.1 peroxidase [Rheinheimera sp.]MBM33191.1 peroxidase [Rheinheimera sp.]HAW92574.1 peroxidase [Candidatus Azambacteria bacterium]|tara:strand:- start:27474 stop:28433 length:960 start_codon:yes stop_codon:yes gene_type:complete
MAREQLGICAEANLHASYLLFNAIEGHEAILRQKLAQVALLLARLAEHFSEAQLTGVVAIGADYWDSLYPGARPLGLQPFPLLASDNLAQTEVWADLFIQIRSDRLDVNYIACQQICQILKNHVDLLEQLQGFRYLDGRDLTGFIDTPHNPKGSRKRQLALVDATKQPVFAAGSYLHLQRWHYDMARWQQLDILQQEEIMGISKIEGSILPAARLQHSSHTLTSRMGNVESTPLLVMQNMPFAQHNSQGLISLSYAGEADSFRQQLSYQLGYRHDNSDMLQPLNNQYDLLFDFCHTDLCAAFFAPSLSFLEMACLPASG